jgi:hypothetical protein
MSIQFKPSEKDELRYDREAKQFRDYLKSEDNKHFAESASKPLMTLLDNKFAKQGEV